MYSLCDNRNVTKVWDYRRHIQRSKGDDDDDDGSGLDVLQISTQPQ